MGVVMAPCVYFGYWLGKKNENPKMWIIILVLAAAMFMALVPGTTLLKSIMHRPRYRIAVYEGYAPFHNWWQACKEYKDYIAANAGVLTKEEFKSFPSGHAGASAVFMMFATFLPLINSKYEKFVYYNDDK